MSDLDHLCDDGHDPFPRRRNKYRTKDRPAFKAFCANATAFLAPAPLPTRAELGEWRNEWPETKR